MAPPSDSSSQNTPLAPSVEKAYYRKCIELKRRLNEVEAANDEAKTRRVRLDRAIMKMRLERAFLLEQLSKRMEHNVDGSDGSGEEGMATTQPPRDRPHRDKRRRQGNPQPATRPSHSSHGTTHASPYGSAHPAFQRVSSSEQAPGGSLPVVQGPGGVLVPANAVTNEGQYVYLPPQTDSQHPSSNGSAPPPSSAYNAGLPAPLQHTSPYGALAGAPTTAGVHMNGVGNLEIAADERSERHGHVQRSDGEAGLSANGAQSSLHDHVVTSGGGGFTAVNQRH